MSIQFEFLKHGDCTIITTDEFTMMIDGGYTNPFDPLDYDGTPPPIDIIVVTHIDHDHIGGVIECLKNEEVARRLKHVVFNEPKNAKLFKKLTQSTNTHSGHGNLLGTAIEFNKDINHINHVFTTINGNIDLNHYGTKKGSITGNTQFIVVSPSQEKLNKLYDSWNPEFYKQTTNTSTKTKKGSEIETLSSTDVFDTGIPNGSSLAFLIIHNTKQFLILGDAHIKQVTEKLIAMGYKDSDGQRLKLEFVKLSHHGSKRSTSRQFLSLIETEYYVISKSRPTPSRDPDRETIAKIAKYGNSNNKTKYILVNDKANNLGFSENDKKIYNFEIDSTCNFGFRY